MTEIPPTLRSLLEGGRGVLFLGAGAGFSAHRSDGSTMPDARGLAVKLCEELNLTSPETDLSKVAEVYELEKGRLRLENRIRSLLQGFTPDEDLSWLFQFRWRAIYTTNYDDLIQQAYAANPNPLQNPVTMVSTRTVAQALSEHDVPVYHLHGAIFPEDSPPLLITESDYARFRAHRKMIFSSFARDAATGGVFYAGYSHNDPNWRTILEEVLGDLQEVPPLAFRLSKSTPEIDRRILNQKRNIYTIDGTFSSFRESYLRTFGPFDPRQALAASITLSNTRLEKLRNQNATATVRLDRAWEYLDTEVTYGESPNIHQFLEGMMANWPLVAQARHFERDIEPRLLEDILEVATAPKPKVQTRVVLGPAGSGVSTVLRSVAIRAVQEGLGSVFFLRPMNEVTLGDVLFVMESLRGFCLFVVDDAAEHAKAVQSIVTSLRGRDLRCCFLMGDRINEWGQRGNARHTTYHLDRLSNSEIPKLIAFLEANNALGHLADLSEAERTAVIAKGHGKQLLVTLKEATANKSFDAIIQDEYRNIQTPLGQAIYAITSATHQFKTGIRDGVIARVTKRDWSSFFSEIGHQLDGVISWDFIGRNQDVQIARCRHATIANVVWAQCPSPYEKGAFLRSIVDGFNLYEFADRRAFDALIRNFDDVGLDTPLDDRMRFFETAIRKDPDNPYVRQHYARMLMNEGNLEAALGQIEHEVAKRSDIAVIHHTRGLIYGKLSLTVEGDLLARKRLRQAEEEFRTCIRLYRRDYHPYESLARLYLDWSEQREASEDARSGLRSRAQTSINEGLRNALDRRPLFVVQSRIDSLLEHDPNASERSLRKAAHLPVARFLLAKLMLTQGRLKEAADICSETMIADPKDPRIAVLYAQVLDRQSEDFERLIAVLQTSRSHGGMSDPRHVAAYAGSLQMAGRLDDARSAFARARDVLSWDERKATWYKPRWHENFRITGRIVNPEPHNLMVLTRSQGSFRASKQDLQHAGLNVADECSFRPVFTGAGGEARDIQRRI